MNPPVLKVIRHVQSVVDMEFRVAFLANLLFTIRYRLRISEHFEASPPLSGCRNHESCNSSAREFKRNLLGNMAFVQQSEPASDTEIWKTLIINNYKLDSSAFHRVPGLFRKMARMSQGRSGIRPYRAIRPSANPPRTPRAASAETCPAASRVPTGKHRGHRAAARPAPASPGGRKHRRFAPAESVPANQASAAGILFEAGPTRRPSGRPEIDAEATVKLLQPFPPRTRRWCAGETPRCAAQLESPSGPTQPRQRIQPGPPVRC